MGRSRDRPPFCLFMGMVWAKLVGENATLNGFTKRAVVVYCECRHG
ncbi:hypothetical protein KKC1_24140 [Calderihabitans maritimus]|uniref:Uncharacterized protein n=1 Tax=Calderihabitans maritimus TaxID=1246530 RepID=A0A1Z5HVB7_9FIRM|nr:hypothetical protein KKC1_24140 [Calderihabitans maritimus]